MTRLLTMMRIIKKNLLMKKIYIILCAAIAALALAGCQKENDTVQGLDARTHTIVFTAEKMIDTRTAIASEGDGVVSYKWIAGDDERMEILEFYTVEKDGTTETKINKGTITGMSLSNNDKSATFTATFSGDAPANLIGYQAAYAGSFANTSHNPKIPAAQSPLSDTFDPAADVLVSDVFQGGRETTSFVFDLTRKVSVNKMTLKGLEEGEVISTVTFESDKQHAATYVLNTGNYSGDGKKLTFTYTSNNTVPSTGEFPVYFTTAPVTDATFTVKVTTNAAVYEKTSSKVISFELGKVRRFGVDLSENRTPISSGTVYTLVESNTDIVDGADYLIVGSYDLVYKAMAAQRTSNRGASEELTVDNNTITIDNSSDAHVFTLIDYGDNGFVFQDQSDNMYLYGDGAHGNNLKCDASINPSSYWTINVDSSHHAIITNKNDDNSEKPYLKYNHSGLFSCYGSNSSGTHFVYLYISTTTGGKQNPGLSFTTSSYSFVLGDTNYSNFTGQALNNPNSLTGITWTSDNTSLATVDSNGQVSFVANATGEATITATFTGNDTYSAGSASYTITVNEPIVGPEVVTIAEFLEKEVSTTKWYQITGIITNIANTQYGNFDLEDASGQVYVYGLTSTQQESNDKSFSSLGLQEGYTVTIITLRSEHSGTAQAGGNIPAYYVSHIGLAVTPTSLNFDATGGTKTVTATATGFDGPVTITASSDNNHFSTTVSGTTVTITAGANQGNSEIEGTVTVTATDGTTTKTATISILQSKPVSQAEDGDILWQEDFTGYGTTMPSSATGTHVYEGGTVTYTLKNGGTTTKLYAENSAGGTSPELLISKTNGAFTISGIPTGGASTMTLTFNSNHGDYCAISSSTSGITVGTPSFSENMVSVSIIANSGVSSFDLIITNTNSSNTRVDDFVLVVGAPPVTLSSIAVSGQTTSFTQGGTFSFDGTVTATYSDGSTQDVTSSASFSGYDLSNTGNQTVTVSYTEDGVTKTTTYTITVSASGGGSTPTLQYTLNGTITATGSAYATASTILQNNIGWKVEGNTEQNPWRIGGKGITNQDRAIYSTTAISANISQINVTSGATASSLTVNSMTISVHNSASDAQNGTNAIASKTVTSGIASRTVTFDKADNTSWAGKYYRIVYNVTRTSTSGNGYITFENATFYGTN